MKTENTTMWFINATKWSGKCHQENRQMPPVKPVMPPSKNQPFRQESENFKRPAGFLSIGFLGYLLLVNQRIAGLYI